MEQGTGWSYHCPRQPHGIVSLRVEEVEAVPAFHEDTRQVGLADDWVNNKGEAPRLQNVVGETLSVESDHSLLRPKLSH